MCIGVPGQVVEILDASTQQVLVGSDGAHREVSAALLGVRDDGGAVHGGDGDPEGAVGVGDWVAVHMGFAMEKLDESEARDVLGAIDALQQEYEQAVDTSTGVQDPGAA